LTTQNLEERQQMMNNKLATPSIRSLRSGLLIFLVGIVLSSWVAWNVVIMLRERAATNRVANVPNLVVNSNLLWIDLRVRTAQIGLSSLFAGAIVLIGATFFIRGLVLRGAANKNSLESNATHGGAWLTRLIAWIAVAILCAAWAFSIITLPVCPNDVVADEIARLDRLIAAQNQMVADHRDTVHRCQMLADQLNSDDAKTRSRAFRELHELETNSWQMRNESAIPTLFRELDSTAKQRMWTGLMTVGAESGFRSETQQWIVWASQYLGQSAKMSRYFQEHSQ
jgi:hypothetical protein